MASTSPLRGNFFAGPGRVRTNVRTGVARNGAGTRILTIPADFLRAAQQVLVQECGPGASLIWKSCGRAWGQRFAARWEKELRAFHGMEVLDLSVAEFTTLLEQLFCHNGWGTLTIDLSQVEQGLIEAEVRSPIMASLVSEQDNGRDALFVGLLAALLSHFSGRELDCVQTDCSPLSSRFAVGTTDALQNR